MSRFSNEQNHHQKARRKLESARDCLKQYSWPGNIRELSRVIEAAILLALEHGHTTIEIEDLPAEILQNLSMNLPFPQPQITENFDLSKSLARVELYYIEQALNLTKGRKTEAWKILGLNDRFALRRRVKIIFEKYPELKKEFAKVASMF